MDVKRTSFAIKRVSSNQVSDPEWESVLLKIAPISRAITCKIAYNVPNTNSTSIPNVMSDPFIENILPRRFKGYYLQGIIYIGINGEIL